MADWLYLIIGIAVVGVLTLAGLLTSGRRRKGDLPAAGGTDVIAPPPTDTDTAVEAPPEPAVETAPAGGRVEKPEGTASRLVRLRQRLSRSQGGLGQGLLALLSRDKLDEDTWEAIEDTLLTADVGVAPTQALVERLRTRLRVEGGQPPDARTVLREELIELVGTDMDRRVQVTGTDGKPGVVLVVGVNGAGKTTTVGKIARILVAEDLSRHARRGRHVPRRGRRPAGHVGRARRRRGRPRPRGRRPRQRGLRGGQARRRATASTRCSSTPPAACRTRPA